MPVNIFAAGTDALLNMLAERDAARRLQEDRDRRARLDDEERAAREREFSLRQRQIQSAEAERAERRKLAAEAEDARRKQNLLKQADIEAYRSATDPEEKERARLTLELKHGIKVAVPPAPRLRSVSPGQRIINEDTGEVIYTAPERPRPVTADPRTKDDPLLPRGTKGWIDTIAARGVPIEQAVQELAAGWPGQRESHPNADMRRGVEYLKGLYLDPDEIDLTPPAAAAGEPFGATPAQPAPAAPARGRGTGPGPRGTGGAPARPQPSEGSVVTLRDGSRVRITKIYPDGTFDSEPVR